MDEVYANLDHATAPLPKLIAALLEAMAAP
jgi:hypothetical protein